MAAIYDASYRRDDESQHRSSILEHSEAVYGEEAESTHQFGSDDDDVSEIGPSDADYSPTTARGSVMHNIGMGAIGMTSQALQAGARLFYQQRQCVQMGEGPTLLRLLCFVGGLVMLTSSILSVVNVFGLLTSPSTYVLQLYQGFFGLIIMVVEAKDWDCFDQFKPWMTEWFRFLTVPAGKGAFYLFVGSLGVSLWVRNLLSFTVGLYMAFMGIVCIAVHAGTSWKTPTDQYHLYDQDYVLDAYGNPVRQDIVDGALSAAFHDPEGQVGVYGGPNTEIGGNLIRRETTTTSTGYSIPARPRSGGVKNDQRQVIQGSGPNRFNNVNTSSSSSLSTAIPY